MLVSVNWKLVTKILYDCFNNNWHAIEGGGKVVLITEDQAKEYDYNYYLNEKKYYADWFDNKTQSEGNGSHTSNHIDERKNNGNYNNTSQQQKEYHNPFLDDDEDDNDTVVHSLSSTIIENKRSVNQKQSPNEDPNIFFQGREFMPVWLGEQIKDNYLISSFYDGQMLYRYENGIFKPDGEYLVRNVSQKLLKDRSRKRFIDETLYWIKNDSIIGGTHLVNQDDGIINVKNGLLDWRTRHLLPHDPKRLSTIQLPVHYDPYVNDPAVLKFLKEIMPHDTVNTFLEFLGYCLIPGRRYHKALMMTGTGSNGKSTLINLVESFIGDANCTHIPLQQLESDRFMTARLYGKLLNTFADLPARGLDKSDVFKTITGDDSLTAQFKGKDSFEYKPICKLIFSANEIPHSDDTTDGFFRRWLIIPFPNKFEGKARDSGKLKQLQTEVCLSTLLNLAIEGLCRLEENGAFTENETIRHTRQQYRKSTDSVTTFVEECCVFGDNFQYVTSELYEAYVAFCKETGLHMLTKIRFHDQLKSKFKIADYKKVKGKGYCWLGIKVKDDFELLPRNFF